MIYRTYIPQSPLSGFVDLFWYHEGFDLPHPRECHLPIGTVELVFNLRPNSCRTFGGAVFCGPSSEPSVLETAQQSSLMGVHFKPGRAFPFFNLPLSELHNLRVSLTDLWGASAGDVREQLLTTQTVEARFRLLERVLLAQVSLPLRSHPAIVFALRRFQEAPHECTVSEILEQVGCSQRHFVRLFSREVGLKPKLFIRLQRFHRTLCKVGMQSQLDWTDLALDCGYFDQAHLIHDFRAFSGLTPSTWLKLRGDFLNQVPIDYGCQIFTIQSRHSQSE
jgi:AraC-like DNA-binding protein